jgi:glycosyltransferase involved in cell wall biosynthesis
VASRVAIRVLYLASTLRRTGPTNQLFNLVKNLPVEQFEPTVLTLSPEAEDSLWPDFSAMNIALRSMAIGRLRGVVSGLRRLTDAIQQLQPDIVHSQGVRADVLASKLTCTARRVCTVRNYPVSDYRFSYGVARGSVMAAAHVHALRRLDKVVGVSHAVARNLACRHGLREVGVVRNGVDTERFSPAAPEDRSSLRRTLRLPREARVWVVSGHLSLRKDPLFVIDAWCRAFGHSDMDMLVFLGGGELEARCRAAASGFDNVRIVGRVADVSAYLRSGDIYVSASKAEGLPNAALEGLAAGLSVLLSDIVPHRELWEIDPGVGSLFRVGDRDGFAQAAGELVRTHRTGTNEASRRLVAQNCSASVMAQSYQDLYLQLRNGGC